MRRWCACSRVPVNGQGYANPGLRHTPFGTHRLFELTGVAASVEGDGDHDNASGGEGIEKHLLVVRQRFRAQLRFARKVE